MTVADLGQAPRSWRRRVPPAAAGLPDAGVRRLPGLRREELAVLAGISVDYLVQLEQGRARHPSPQVLGALARALRLSADERDTLHRLAGVAPPPAGGVVPRRIGPGTGRVLDRLYDTPMAVFTASWDLVLADPLWVALIGGAAAMPGGPGTPGPRDEPRGQGADLVQVREVDRLDPQVHARRDLGDAAPGRLEPVTVSARRRPPTHRGGRVRPRSVRRCPSSPR